MQLGLGANELRFDWTVFVSLGELGAGHLWHLREHVIGKWHHLRHEALHVLHVGHLPVHLLASKRHHHSIHHLLVHHVLHLLLLLLHLINLSVSLAVS